MEWVVERVWDAMRYVRELLYQLAPSIRTIIHPQVT